MARLKAMNCQAVMSALAILAGDTAAAVTPISPPTAVPVLLTPSEHMDACPSTVRPKLPRGGADGFLSLRAGPGAAWPETMRLHRSDLMYACANSNGWQAVVVQPAGGGDCGVSTYVRVLRRYTGPCRSGWVAERYLETVAG